MQPSNKRLVTEASAKSILVPQAKQVRGGVMPKPLRVPQLGVEQRFPDTNVPFRGLLWVESSGDVIYSTGSDGMIRKSTDTGATWVNRGYTASGVGQSGIFLKTGAGTLLGVTQAVTPPQILRSTDDGATWATVHTYRTNALPLGAQSWDIDRVTGYIYYGEYTAAGYGATDVKVWRSIDDGTTWGEFYTWPAATSGSTGPDGYITHVHSVQWDHIAQRIVVMCGDGSPNTGLWRVNAAGDSMERIVTNEMLGAPTPTSGSEWFDAPRAIGIMPFQDYIVWASDSTANPYLFRIARTEIGKTKPQIERIYQLNSTSWFTCRASDDGARWVVCSSDESALALDKMVHLYAVEDQGATVWEVGTLARPQVAGTPAASLMPVGLADKHGAAFFMQTRTAGRSAAWKFRLGYGGGQMIDWPSQRPTVLAWQTVNSGRVSMNASDQLVFATDKAPALASKLYVFNISIGRESGDSGSVRAMIRKKGAAATYEGSQPSDRQAAHAEWGPYMAVYSFTSGDDIEFVIRNSSTTNPAVGTATVVYGWGA